MQDLDERIQTLLPEAVEHPSSVARALAGWHVADIIEVLNRVNANTAVDLIQQLPEKTVTQIFNYPGLDHPSKLLESLPPKRGAAVLENTHPDRRAEIFRNVSPDGQERLLELFDSETKGSLDKILNYPPETAGSIMTTDFVHMPTTWTVKQALDHIRAIGSETETIYPIYLLDPESNTLARTISLRQLVIANPEQEVGAVALQRKPIYVLPLTDREEVARLISRYDLLAVPVVDEGGKVLGIVTVDDVIDAIMAEGTEDAQKFGGMEALDGPYMQMSLMTMIKKRAGWLSALFLSEMLTASAMQHYSNELEKAVVLTLFIPLIMSSGGNSGSQATSLIIRALALHEVKLGDWWQVAKRELPAGLMLGAILAVIGIFRIVVWQKLGIFDYGVHWHLVAATVGTALVGIVMFGSLAGSMLPFALKRLGFDPASASAPFVATLVDVTGLVIYFSVAFVILRGTLL